MSELLPEPNDVESWRLLQEVLAERDREWGADAHDDRDPDE